MSTKTGQGHVRSVVTPAPPQRPPQEGGTLSLKQSNAGMYDFTDQLKQSLGDGYTIQRELGGGGMSRVFLAHERALDRAVVIKALLPELASGVSVRRFAQEVRAAAMLQHPHIVPVLCSGHTSDEIPYYVMPFVRGETLRQRLERGRVPFVETVQLVGDVAKALAAAHEADVIHRDIKPDNVLLSGGAAVVTDFGIARALHAARTSRAPAASDEDGLHAEGGGASVAEEASADPDAEFDARLTLLGSSLGTPAYMAPEQVAGDEIDSRTDIYSWGVVTYEMLVGHHPFPAANSAQKLMAAHVSERIAPLSHRSHAAPGWFCWLVMSCLEKDPAHRPADGAALVHFVEYGASAHRSRPALTVARWASSLGRLFGGR